MGNARFARSVWTNNRRAREIQVEIERAINAADIVDGDDRADGAAHDLEVNGGEDQDDGSVRSDTQLSPDAEEESDEPDGVELAGPSGDGAQDPDVATARTTRHSAGDGPGDATQVLSAQAV